MMKSQQIQRISLHYKVLYHIGELEDAIAEALQQLILDCTCPVQIQTGEDRLHGRVALKPADEAGHE